MDVDNYEETSAIYDELEAGAANNEEEEQVVIEGEGDVEENSDADEAVETPSQDDAEEDPQPGEQGDSTPDGEPAAPEHWSEEDKAAFNAATPEMKDWALRRDKSTEALVTKKTQELAEQQRTIEPLLTATEKHDEYFKSLGVDKAFAFDHLVTAEKALRMGTPEQKAQQFAQLAQDYGVDLSALAGVQTPEGQQGKTPVQTVTPEMTALQQEMQALRQNVANQEQEALVQQVKDFEAETDDSGQLKHPHFADVRIEMGKLIQAFPDMTMGDAYNKAVLLNSDIQAKLAEEKKAAEVLERNKKAAAAKKSKVVPAKKGSSTAKPQKKYTNSEDMVADIYDELENTG